MDVVSSLWTFFSLKVPSLSRSGGSSRCLNECFNLVWRNPSKSDFTAVCEGPAWSSTAECRNTAAAEARELPGRRGHASCEESGKLFGLTGQVRYRAWLRDLPLQRDIAGQHSCRYGGGSGLSQGEPGSIAGFGWQCYRPRQIREAVLGLSFPTRRFSSQQD